MLQYKKQRDRRRYRTVQAFVWSSDDNGRVPDTTLSPQTVHASKADVQFELLVLHISQNRPFKDNKVTDVGVNSVVFCGEAGQIGAALNQVSLCLLNDSLVRNCVFITLYRVVW